MSIIEDQVKVCEQMAEVIQAIDGVTLKEYRVGLSAGNESCVLTQEFKVEIARKSFGWRSLWMPVQVTRLERICGQLTKDFDKTTCASPLIERGHKRYNVGQPEGKYAYLELAHFVQAKEGDFQVKGKEYKRLVVHTNVITTESFPAVHESFYNLNDERMPEELLNLWAKLNKKAGSWKEYTAAGEVV
ncbi:hypothetical protein HY837_03120 [archaeon]|nr:hypothetical protein [archaeon]